MKKRAPKVKADFGALDIYKFYCKRTGNAYKLSQKEYSEILRAFYNKVFDRLIYRGSEFTMPFKLGNLRIKKQKIKLKLLPDGSLDKTRLRPDWKACRELWASKYSDKVWEEIIQIKGKPMIYHENRHTDRYSHGWHWDKSTCIVVNNTAYSIDIARDVDRRLAKALKSNLEVDYSLY